MTANLPIQFEGVSVVLKANVYFNGHVISHAIHFPDGTRKTIGTIYHGSYKFDTGAPERMEIIAGSCRVKIANSENWVTYEGGTYFEVPGHSFFEITVAEGVAEYVCSFMPEKAS